MWELNSSIQLYRFAVYIIYIYICFFHAEILRHTCFIICSNIDIESVCIYILSIYMCVYCILLCFIFCESLFLKTMMDSDIVLLTEVKLANHKPLRLWLPEPVCHQLYIYNTYWYIMYAYFWIHIHEFQPGKSLLQKPRRANKKRNANSKGIVGPRPNHSDEMFEPTFVMIVK